MRLGDQKRGIHSRGLCCSCVGGREGGREKQWRGDGVRERWPVKCFPYVPEGWERLITLWWWRDIAIAVCVCVPVCERVFCTSPYLSFLWNPHTEHTGVTLENPELSHLRPTANPLNPVFLQHTKTCSSHKTHPKCYGRKIDKSRSKQHSYPLKNNCSLKYAFVWLCECKYNSWLGFTDKNEWFL